MKKTYKQIEASRNRRLWITTVAMPVTALGVTIASTFPEARNAIGKKAVDVTNSIKSKFKKESISDKITIISIEAYYDKTIAALEARAKQVNSNAAE